MHKTVWIDTMPPKMTRIKIPKPQSPNPIPTRRRRNNEKLRLLTLIRDEYICRQCEEVFPEHKLECDHIIPLSMGGKDDLRNTQTLCIPCHSEKTKKEIVRYAKETTTS